jgi:hypothetical protein
MLKHLLKHNSLIFKISQIAQSALKYAVAAMLLAIPLFPKFPFINIPGTQVAIRLEDFLILITFFIWGMSVLPNVMDMHSDKITRSVILFLLIGLVSVYSGIFLTKTVIFHIGLLHWARRVEYLACLLIGIQAVRDKANLRFFIKILLLVILFAFIYGLGQKYQNWPVITTQNSEYSKGVALRYREGGHLASTFAGHYDLATYIILTTPIFYAFLLGSSKTLELLNLHKNTKVGRGILFTAITISLWLLVNAASRISMVSYVGSIGLLMLIMKKFKLIPLMVIFTLIFTSMSSNLIDRYTNIFEVSTKNLFSQLAAPVYAQEETKNIRVQSSLLEKANPMNVFEDRSTSIRLNVEWPRAIRAFRKNPILGTGYSSITLATDNDYLRMLGEVGALGFIAFFLLLYRIARKSVARFTFKNQRSLGSLYALAIFAALPGIMLNMVFIDLLEASKFATMFWLLTGFAIGINEYEDKS